MKTKKWFYFTFAFLVLHCLILNIVEVMPLFCQISLSIWYLRCWVHDFERGYHGTMFRGYGVQGFESKDFGDMGYIVYHYREM